MAALFNPKINKQEVLHANHTFGRDEKTNTTILVSPSASRNHATIAWDGESWKIKDSSTNGTFIDNHRLPPGRYHPLLQGAKIQFGSIPSETWEVVDTAPPVTGLIPLSDTQPFIPLHDVYLLPIPDHKILLLLSEGGLWQCEANEERFTLQSGDKVGANGLFWQFVDARPCAATAIITPASITNNIKFCFQVSPDEEHVSLKLVVDNLTINLGERNHHYLLLLLAKQRLKDANRGLDVSDQGWIDKELLMRMMKMAEQHINIQVHRFRKQVTKMIPNSSTLQQVIERRPGELRFAYSDIAIEGGFNVQAK
ncbi:FHA domain-containing protein [Marinibactrum halimedae]|uniref:Phosphopeptide-binding protein n=1 Tax=Marinibactrum halimedae TaxID=1444977 RepID=A0AA37WN22_9GAMM|nr:FHA domain-containing protein [Marinibactrum halimedae]MCD9458023.1 FHA domain-containing protein [Marinibactrum halimedae]GLS27649.1 phosphopeptide-binding protein [Marinibactrum halimedae]